jgi:hypothetical protein
MIFFSQTTFLCSLVFFLFYPRRCNHRTNLSHYRTPFKAQTARSISSDCDISNSGPARGFSPSDAVATLPEIRKEAPTARVTRLERLRWST